MKMIKNSVWGLLVLPVAGMAQPIKMSEPELIPASVFQRNVIHEQNGRMHHVSNSPAFHRSFQSLSVSDLNITPLFLSVKKSDDLALTQLTPNTKHLPVTVTGKDAAPGLLFVSQETKRHDSLTTLPTRTPFLKNRRNVYSALWAYASLNYLYADLVGLMDAKKLTQYQTGVVEGVKITPEFLTAAAGFMQIPIASVFLPHVIKNEKTLRWVQIASGAFMSLAQAGTLLVGKPAPYYTLFSVCEIAATMYITIDAIRWKPQGRKPLPVLD